MTPSSQNMPLYMWAISQVNISWIRCKEHHDSWSITNSVVLQGVLLCFIGLDWRFTWMRVFWCVLTGTDHDCAVIQIMQYIWTSVQSPTWAKPPLQGQDERFSFQVKVHYFHRNVMTVPSSFHHLHFQPNLSYWLTKCLSNSEA